MTTCLLVRHGQSQANVDGVLAGHLDSTLTDEGLAQARRVAEALSGVPVRRIVTSPLSRCRATAEQIAALQPPPGAVDIEERLGEVRYGAWTGRTLQELAREDLWRAIQAAPSSVTFPAHEKHPHESMTAMAERAWVAWAHWDARVRSEAGEGAVWLLVSHGDVIKAVLARALGLALDAFQSIVVDPGSVSVVHHAGDRTAVSGLNIRDDTLARLADPGRHGKAVTPSVGVVGGGDG